MSWAKTPCSRFGPYVRHDTYRYIPSANLLNDLGPIQQESVGQNRSLTNAGVHSDVSLTHGRNNIKVGGVYAQTFLRENDTLGIVDPNLNDPNAPSFDPVLAPYDLTRGGTTYRFHGQTDVKQLALYAQDAITAGNFQLNLGMRGDFYNGLVIDRQAEPRASVSYNLKRTGTVLRASYARTQETPFNENLVLSQNGCYDPVLNGIFSTLGSCTPAVFRPGFRNEFHVGFGQSVGQHFVLSAEYITKYTHNGYDFSVLGATPITFPIEWHNSKIPGYALTATLTNVHGFSARTIFSSVAARFFNPQIGGVGATIGSPGGLPFRIDHDERFNQTTHLEYAAPFRKSMYISFNWRYDSGLVAGAVPCYNVTGGNTSCGDFSVSINGQPGINLSSLTYDQQFQAGLRCNGVAATATSGFTQCLASQLTSNLVTIPSPGTQDNDRNPQRIQPRSLFDMEVGDDHLVRLGHEDRYHLGARVTAVNLTNKVALYNFLSTFSGDTLRVTTHGHGRGRVSLLRSWRRSVSPPETSLTAIRTTRSSLARRHCGKVFRLRRTLDRDRTVRTSGLAIAWSLHGGGGLRTALLVRETLFRTLQRRSIVLFRCLVSQRDGVLRGRIAVARQLILVQRGDRFTQRRSLQHHDAVPAKSHETNRLRRVPVHPFLKDLTSG